MSGLVQQQGEGLRQELDALREELQALQGILENMDENPVSTERITREPSMRRELTAHLPLSSSHGSLTPGAGSTALDLTFEIDTALKVTAWPTPMAKATGLAHDDVVGKSLVDDLVVPADRDGLHAYLDPALAGNTTESFELALVGRRGHILRFTFVAGPHFNQAGRLAGAVLSVPADGPTARVFAVDADNRLTHWSQEMAELTGLAPESVLGLAVDRLLEGARDARDAVVQALRKAVRDDTQTPAVPLHVQALAGDLVRLPVDVRPLSLRDGARVGAAGFVPVRAIDRARARRAQLLTQPLFRLDVAGKVVEWSPRAETLTGVPASRVLHKSLVQAVCVFPRRPAVLDAFKHALAGTRSRIRIPVAKDGVSLYPGKAAAASATGSQGTGPGAGAGGGGGGGGGAAVAGHLENAGLDRSFLAKNDRDDRNAAFEVPGSVLLVSFAPARDPDGTIAGVIALPDVGAEWLLTDLAPTLVAADAALADLDERKADKASLHHDLAKRAPLDAHNALEERVGSLHVQVNGLLDSVNEAVAGKLEPLQERLRDLAERVAEAAEAGGGGGGGGSEAAGFSTAGDSASTGVLKRAIASLDARHRELEDLLARKAERTYADSIKRALDETNSSLTQLKNRVKVELLNEESNTDRQEKMEALVKTMLDPLRTKMQDYDESISYLTKEKASWSAVEGMLEEKASTADLGAKANVTYVESLYERLNNTVRNEVDRMGSRERDSEGRVLEHIHNIQAALDEKVDRADLVRVERDLSKLDTTAKFLGEDDAAIFHRPAQNVRCLTCDRFLPTITPRNAPLVQSNAAVGQESQIGARVAFERFLFRDTKGPLGSPGAAAKARHASAHSSAQSAAARGNDAGGGANGGGGQHHSERGGNRRVFALANPAGDALAKESSESESERDPSPGRKNPRDPNPHLHAHHPHGHSHAALAELNAPRPRTNHRSAKKQASQQQQQASQMQQQDQQDPADQQTQPPQEEGQAREEPSTSRPITAPNPPGTPKGSRPAPQYSSNPGTRGSASSQPPQIV